MLNNVAENELNKKKIDKNTLKNIKSEDKRINKKSVIKKKINGVLKERKVENNKEIRKKDLSIKTALHKKKTQKLITIIKKA